MPSWHPIRIVPAVACAVVAASVLVAGPLTAPAGAAGGCFPAGGRAVPDAATPAGSGIVVQGHGWGHSLGMSQYGAQGAALLGCNHAQILSTYYRGTRLQRRSLTAPVVLSLQSRAVRAAVGAEDGKVTWSVPGQAARAVQPVGTTWRVAGQTRSGRAGLALLDDAGATRLWTGTGVLRAGHTGTTVRLRAYRSGSSTASPDKRLRWGTLAFTRVSGGITVEERITGSSRGTAVDTYLWGLGEVPVSWPAEALRAQVDAARTYLTGSYSAGAYRIGTTTAAQVYTGATREDEDRRFGGRWRAAVTATSGEVIVDRSGTAISAMYSSSDGGRSEDRAYVYGNQGGYGYLTSVDDSRWELASGDPHRSWAKVFTPQDFAAALGFGSVSAVSLAPPGSSGRDAGLRVTGVIGGSARTVAFTGAAVRSALGLRSAAITVRWVPPAPVPPVQAPPVQPLAGDWDGDGKDEVGLFRSGQVSLRLADGTVLRYPLGRAGDFAVVGDWDGDGRDSVGVFRAGTWYLRNELSAGPAEATFRFGSATGYPVTGRWSGRSAQGIAVVSGGSWQVRRTATAGPADATFAFGTTGDVPVAGDWDGDGRDTPGTFRAGQFRLLPGLAAGPATTLAFGAAGDLPVTGNWDGAPGDGPGVYRPGTFLYRDGVTGTAPTTTLAFTG